MTTLRELIGDPVIDPVERHSAVKPYLLSHGTMECRELLSSRKFYEEFLGLQCVVHSPTSMSVRCGLKFGIVAVEVGDHIHQRGFLTHWGLDMLTREEVDQAHAAAVAQRETYGLRDITNPNDRHGVYQFFIQDADYNWWEFQHYPGFLHDDMFDFGDQYDLAAKAN